MNAIRCIGRTAVSWRFISLVGDQYRHWDIVLVVVILHYRATSKAHPGLIG